MSSSSLKIVLQNGVIGSTERQKKTVLGLGLKYRNAIRDVNDTPAIRGMIAKVRHLVKIVKNNNMTSQLYLKPEYELGKVLEKPVSAKKNAKKLKVTSASGTSLDLDTKEIKKMEKKDSKKSKTLHTKKEKTNSAKSAKKVTNKNVKKVKKS